MTLSLIHQGNHTVERPTPPEVMAATQEINFSLNGVHKPEDCLPITEQDLLYPLYLPSETDANEGIVLNFQQIVNARNLGNTLQSSIYCVQWLSIHLLSQVTQNYPSLPWVGIFDASQQKVIVPYLFSGDPKFSKLTSFGFDPSDTTFEQPTNESNSGTEGRECVAPA